MKIGTQLPDTPFHFSYLHMPEGDTRRHKARCIHLNRDTDKCNCTKSQYFNLKCWGSAKCNYYKEAQIDNQGDDTMIKIESGDVVLISTSAENKAKLYVFDIDDNNRIHGSIIVQHRVEDEPTYDTSTYQLSDKFNLSSMYIVLFRKEGLATMEQVIRKLTHIPKDEQNSITQAYNDYMEYLNKGTDAETEPQLTDANNQLTEDIEKSDLGESKRDKFIRLAERRIDVIHDSIKILTNLSNKNNYDYTVEMVEQIFERLEMEIQESKKKFMESEKEYIPFKFKL